DVRARNRRLGPDLPGDDLAAVHGARRRLRAVPDGVPRCPLLAGVDLAPPPVRDERRLLDVRRLADDDLPDDDRGQGAATAVTAETVAPDATAHDHAAGAAAPAAAPAADDDRAAPGTTLTGGSA